MLLMIPANASSYVLCLFMCTLIVYLGHVLTNMLNSANRFTGPTLCAPSRAGYKVKKFFLYLQSPCATC